jgi:putative salt-induced outer membrane protein
MTLDFRLLGASALALMVGSTAALAQTTITGIRDINESIDDTERDARRNLDRGSDAYRFGNPEYREGLSGSASLGYTGATGNSDSSEFTLGARLRSASGPFVQTIGVLLEFSETDGVKSKEEVFGVYDANYYFNNSLYGFVLGRVSTDGLAVTADETATDAFIGMGPGYRIINSDQTSWRLQAGVGVSYLKDGLDNDTTEMGYIASSRFYHRFNESIFATMDTDILKSDSALRVNNDLGMNFQVSDAFATRVSYLTEYNDSRAIETDNKLGVSLVYGF